MKNYNNVTLVGKVVKEVEYKKFNENGHRATFTLSVARPYKDAEGVAPCDFMPIVTWDRLAVLADEVIKKDDIVLVNGRIQSRSYESNSEARWIMEIIAESFNVL